MTSHSIAVEAIDDDRINLMNEAHEIGLFCARIGDAPEELEIVDAEEDEEIPEEEEFSEDDDELPDLLTVTDFATSYIEEYESSSENTPENETVENPRYILGSPRTRDWILLTLSTLIPFR